VHLVLGFSTFVSLLIVTLAAYVGSVRVDSVARARALQWIALASTVLAFAAVFAGGWMAASNDGLACTALPLCGATGALTPDQQLHMGHRFAAYVTILAVAVTWLVAIKTSPRNTPV